MKWYPIKLTAHVRTYAFGERLIPEMLGKTGVPDGVVAETWEISDYQDTTGTVTNGELAGRTLHDMNDELSERAGRGRVERAALPAAGEVPRCLAHAAGSPACRRRDGEADLQCAERQTGGLAHPLGGAERLDPGRAQPDDPSEQELFDAFKAQDYDRVMPRYPIQAGDTVYVPGGIIHSFGPGTLILRSSRRVTSGRT